MKSHPVCRPPKFSGNTMRLGFNNQWRPDNGQPGLAFVTLLTPKQQKTKSATVWVAECKCKHYGTCVLSKALNDAAEMYGGASAERVPVIRRKR